MLCNIGGHESIFSRRKPELNCGLPRPIGIGEPDFTGRTRWVYQELRDRKVALFLDKLPEGIWQLRYDRPSLYQLLALVGMALPLVGIRLQGRLFWDILRVGLIASFSAFTANLTAMMVTGLVGNFGVAALAASMLSYHRGTDA